MIIECRFHVDRAEVESVPRCGPFCMGFFLFPFHCAHLGKEEKEQAKNKKIKK